MSKPGQTMQEVTDDEPKKRSSSSWSKLGLLLILVSGVCFFSMLAVPWFPISGNQKVLLGGALFVAMQIAWWAGATLAGTAAVNAVLSRLTRLRKSLTQ